MKYLVNVSIKLEGDIEPEILHLAISPENVTMPSGTISSILIENGVSTEIVGVMEIGRLIYTIDDILKAAILANSVSQVSDMDKTLTK
ncbi:MAG: hypothetical protein ACXAB7_07800 [Candidatus Kariarchaeaceae archaeon]|jgi:hypothetical protein